MLNRSLIQDADAGGWWQFQNARAIVAVTHIRDVLSALREIERRVDREGLWAVGFVSYEAAPAFDSAIRAHAAVALPLLWMGLYPPPQLVQLPDCRPAARIPQYRWQPSVDRMQYEQAITKILTLIEAGDIYQANYTLRLRAPADEDPEALFLRMVQANDPRFGAYLDCGRFVVCSASPELLFELKGEQLTSRPMKGTAGRGLSQQQDLVHAQTLAASEKNRAENVMIADMVRNDIGRIARTGSVQASKLFALERYPTVWQLTSTVTAQTQAPVCDILQALFPPASITGAPKIRAAEVIAEVETTARGVYTGCIGYIAPGRRARFNVAIRTAVLDRNNGQLEYGVGGGIVWDSTSQTEYEECLLKARIVTDTPPPFALLETLLWEPDGGYFLLDEHLLRLEQSANYLGAHADIAQVRTRLTALAASFRRQAQRVRLVVQRDGRISLESSPLSASATPLRLKLATVPVDPANPFLYNKTTHRVIYDEAKAAQPDCDDVVLWNTRGEVTETGIANLVVELDGRKLTPPVECGLLPGVFRAWLLARGEISEQRMNLDDLRRASRIWAVNSVRRWREAKLVD